jgi:surface carbohydrate biosynthesis protein (TIGR04326 family)
MLNKFTIIQFKDKKIELFKYIEENSDILKKEYLELIFKIGNLKIQNQELKEILKFKKNSLWEMSLICEKNIYKHDCVFITIKYLAIKKILIENNLKNLKILYCEKILENQLKKDFGDINIIFKDRKLSYLEIVKKLIYNNILFQHLFFFYYFIKNCSFLKKKK